MYCRSPLIHIIYGEFGVIKLLSLEYLLTTLPYQSHKKKCFEIYSFFEYNFVL